MRRIHFFSAASMSLALGAASLVTACSPVLHKASLNTNDATQQISAALQSQTYGHGWAQAPCAKFYTVGPVIVTNTLVQGRAAVVEAKTTITLIGVPDYNENADSDCYGQPAGGWKMGQLVGAVYLTSFQQWDNGQWKMASAPQIESH